MKGSDKAQELHAELEQKLGELVTSEDWAAMLETAAKFHRYSFRNVLLIAMQRPDATRVAGYNAWKGLGRQVRKGEKGIAILAPMTYRATRENQAGEVEETRVVRGFRVVHVFDLAQTEGEEVADVRPELLEGEGSSLAWGAVEALVKDLGYIVYRYIPEGGANGFCDHEGRRIVVRDDVSGLQALKTLIHEAAHATMHAAAEERSTRDVLEVEAESVAYVVCSALGLDTSGYSLPYVARWANGDLKLVSQTADRVVKAAGRILDALESVAV